MAVLGAAAALIKRASTGYGQHVETSLLDALLFLNAAAIFHREGHRPRIIRHTKSPILRVFDTSDGRAVMVEPQRHRALARAVPPVGHGRRRARLLDARGPLQAVRPRVEPRHAAAGHGGLRLAGRPTSGRPRCWPNRPPSPSATRWPSGWRASRPASTASLQRSTTRCWGGCRWSGRPCGSPSCGPGARRPGRRHGGEQGALGGHRIIDLSSFWAGPLASRLLAELGADVVKVEPPGGEGGFQMMPVLPNIYVDANRSKRGIVLDLKTPEDRVRLLDLVARVGRRRRERHGGRLGAARAGRGGAAGRQSRPCVREGQGLWCGGAFGRPSVLRLRRPGGDRHGDDAGRRARGRCRSTSRRTTTGRGCCWGRASCWRCWGGPAGWR